MQEDGGVQIRSAQQEGLIAPEKDTRFATKFGSTGRCVVETTRVRGATLLQRLTIPAAQSHLLHLLHVCRQHPTTHGCLETVSSPLSTVHQLHTSAGFLAWTPVLSVIHFPSPSADRGAFTISASDGAVFPFGIHLIVGNAVTSNGTVVSLWATASTYIVDEQVVRRTVWLGRAKVRTPVWRH